MIFSMTGFFSTLLTAQTYRETGNAYLSHSHL
jgi:hypothetical protein